MVAGLPEPKTSRLDFEMGVLSEAMKILSLLPNQLAGANRRWHWQFRCRGSRRESAVVQLFSLGGCLHSSDAEFNFYSSN